MKTFNPLVALWLMATAASEQELTWSELAGRPDLWPAQCTVKDTIRFEGGVSIPAGATVDVLDFKGNEADMKTPDGKTYFAAEPEDTDVLAVARAAYAKLTPKQRALTYPAIARQKDLWPYKVTITRSFSLAPGKNVQVGDLVLVKDVQPDRVDVVSTNLNARFAVAVSATDLMAQARKFVEDDSAGPRLLAVQREEQEKILTEQKVKADAIKAEGRLAVEVEGKLINSQTGQPEPLNPNAWPRYYVFLRGQSTCPITCNFAPGFFRYCNSIKTSHPDVEVVYMTVEDLPETYKFTKQLGYDGRAVSYENSYIPSVHPYIDGRIPQLIVMDRDGKVLANGIQSTAPDALQQLKTLLSSSP